MQNKKTEKRGRPIVLSKNVLRAFRIEECVYLRIRIYAKSKNITTADAVRQLINSALSQ